MDMSLSLSFVWKSDSFAIWVWSVTTTRSLEAIPVIPGAQGREWGGRSSQLLARDPSYKQQPSHSSKYQAGWRARVQVEKKKKKLHFSSSFFLKILLVGGLFQVKRLASPATEPSQPSNVPRQIGRLYLRDEAFLNTTGTQELLPHSHWRRICLQPEINQVIVAEFPSQFLHSCSFSKCDLHELMEPPDGHSPQDVSPHQGSMYFICVIPTDCCLTC